MNRTWPDIDAVTHLVDEIAQTAICLGFGGSGVKMSSTNRPLPILTTS